MGKHFLWDPVEDNIIEEFDDAGTTIAEYTTEPYLYGDLISQHRGGQPSFYHYDGQGSTTSLTDSGANVTDTYAYSAFGEVIEHAGSTVNPFQYIGERGYYGEVGLGERNVRRREYLPGRARWISQDPIRDRRLNNLYTYVGNSPVQYVDASGLIRQRVGAVGGELEWEMTIVSRPNMPKKQVAFEAIYRPKSPCCCKAIGFIQIARTLFNGRPVYPGGGNDDIYFRQFDNDTWFSVDHLKGETSPYYGLTWKRGAWRPRDGSVQVGTCDPGPPPNRIVNAKITDKPYVDLTLPPDGPATASFETCVFCIDTQEVLGCIKWGFSVDDSSSPITPVGGTNKDFSLGPSDDFTSAVKQWD